MRGRILVVDDERAIGIAIQRLLGARGHEVDAVLSGEDALRRLAEPGYHLVITDLSLQGVSGMDVLRWVREHAPETAVIMITAFGSEKIAVEAMKLGAADYIPKPFDNDELELVVERLLDGMEVRRSLRLLQEQVAGAYRFGSLIGKSPAMQRVFDVIRKVADTDLTVLVRGPSGTGKELVANALHYNGPRRTKPLVKVNCAAFSRELVESELFGHEKGAFTGAVTAREGKFEIADGGTLFLDEIGDMRLETQAKILRVLQERELEHAIEQAVALASEPEIALGDLPASVRDLSSDGAADPPGSFREAKQQAVERFERQFIHEALARHHGNISKAAEDMGMYRQHLQLKLAEYGIDAAAYRER